jgi:hypothetical protein
MRFFPGLPEGANPRAYILWLIRDGRVQDLDGLRRELGATSGTPLTTVDTMLYMLDSAGLIRWEDRRGGRFAIAEQWTNIQTALALSLREVATLGDSSMVVKPYFGRPDNVAKHADIFVVMPFMDSPRACLRDAHYELRSSPRDDSCPRR